MVQGVLIVVTVKTGEVILHAPNNMGGKGGGKVGTCELQAHVEGGEANKGDHMEGGAGAPGACYVGEHVVVRALGGYGPLFVVAEFESLKVTIIEYGAW